MLRKLNSFLVHLDHMELQTSKKLCKFMRYLNYLKSVHSKKKQI